MKTLAALSLLLALALPLHAESKSATPDLRTITVTGRGEIKAVPDQATYHISLRVRNKVAADAVNQVNTSAQTLIALLAKQSIEKKDITTTNGGVNPEYSNDVPGKIVAYSANYSVSVVFHDFTKASQVMALVSGTSNISDTNGPSLGFSDPLKFENEALTKAVENAKAKALTLAKAGGLTLKEAITIRTSDSSSPRPVMMMAMAARAPMAKMESAPIEAGEQTISASVEVTYAAALP